MILPLMIFAAGFGTRMGALTADRPKPLIKVAGRALIDHALVLAEGAGAAPVVVNLHYLAPMLAAHLAGRGVLLSVEEGQILETGGGLRAALPILRPDGSTGAVMTLNPDAIWTGENPLRRLVAEWDGSRMGAILSLASAAGLRGPGERADFAMDGDGRLTRATGAEGFVYLGAQVIDPAGLREISQEVFSLNMLWDRMIAEGRLFGCRHRGGWCDVGRPEGIAQAESLLRGTADAV